MNKIEEIRKWLNLACQIIIASGAIFAFLWYKDQNRQWEEQRRQEAFRDLMKDFTLQNLAIRRVSARALANYPEAIPYLIESLEEKDTALTTEIKNSIKRMGKDALTPVVNALKSKNEEVKNFLPQYRIPFRQIPLIDTLPLDTLLNERYDIIKRDLISNVGIALNMPVDESLKLLVKNEVEDIISKLNEMRSLKPEIKTARENLMNVLGDLLRENKFTCLQLSDMDLSGAKLQRAYLEQAILTNANLYGANLSNANLRHADLSKANLRACLSKTNLQGANLYEAFMSYTLLDKTDLSNACLEKANLSGTWWKENNLSGANFNGAKLYNVLNFSTIKNFTSTNLADVEGLPPEDLEYARTKGAIIDKDLTCSTPHAGSGL